MLAKFINTKEDSLTASVFSHLLHLPIEVFWQIIRASCDSHELPNHCGEPEIIDPWPKWSAENTTNSRYVEPDLFMRFATFDLIIEAKRWDGGMQYEQQWKNQLIAYDNTYAEETPEFDKYPIYYLALGGIWSQKTQEFNYGEVKDGISGKSCSIYKARWNNILIHCQRFKQALDKTPHPSSQIKANIRLLDDLIDLFAAHGFSTGQWFEDFTFPSFPSPTLTSSQLTLNTLCSKAF